MLTNDVYLLVVIYVKLFAREVSNPQAPTPMELKGSKIRFAKLGFSESHLNIFCPARDGVNIS